VKAVPSGAACVTLPASVSNPNRKRLHIFFMELKGCVLLYRCAVSSSDCLHLLSDRSTAKDYKEWEEFAKSES
jgi:hypothetical protein